MPALYATSIKSLPLLSKGKVRDVYALGDDKLLMITTDRLSAFDVVMGQPIPEKGIVLNQMANFWFDKLAMVIPNHLTGIDPETVVPADEIDQVKGRAVVAKRLKPILVEAVVRGYLAGSGWKDYKETGKVCGIALPVGLENAQKLPEPIFTPAAKAEVGEHDENISFDKVIEMIGEKLANQIREVSIRLYKEASEYAATRGIIIADTKFEFGLDDAGQLVLMDEKFNKVKETVSDAQGKYEFTEVECGKKYYVNTSVEDYETKEPAVIIGSETGKTELNIELKTKTCRVKIGDDLADCFKINIIYFDLDKWNIRPDAAVDLAKLLDVLNQNPSMKINIRSHTDSRASNAYNKKLSERRAKSTKDWLVKNGIAADRLTSEGLGETELVNKCADGVPCSEEDHQLNRRSEFIIISL